MSKKLKPTDQTYWERILIQHGLGMSQGLNKKTDCVGTSNDIVALEEQQARNQEGQPEYNHSKRVTPKGCHPDA